MFYLPEKDFWDDVGFKSRIDRLFAVLLTPHRKSLKEYRKWNDFTTQDHGNIMFLFYRSSKPQLRPLSSFITISVFDHWAKFLDKIYQILSITLDIHAKNQKRKKCLPNTNRRMLKVSQWSWRLVDSSRKMNRIIQHWITGSALQDHRNTTLKVLSRNLEYVIG